MSKQAAITALQSSNPAAAECLCRAALQNQPGDSDTVLLLALSLQQQDRKTEANGLYAMLVRLNPESGLHWGNYASALRDSGDFDQAEKAALTSLRLNPDNVDQLINLGLLQMQRGDFLEARDTLFKSVAVAPDLPEARIHTARACFFCRDRRTEDLLRPWRDWLPLEDALQYELADLQLQSGDARTAQFLLENMVLRTPNHKKAILLLASVYERSNRCADAEVLLKQLSTTLGGEHAEMRTEIARQRALLAVRNRDFRNAKDELTGLGPRNDADYAHYFLLAETCDKLDDVDEAMQALQIAHARQMNDLRATLPHRFSPDAPILPAATGRVTEAGHAHWPLLRAPDPAESPIFIVGFPRSGTTLLEQMLDAHPNLQSMDERPFFNILADRLGDHGIKVPQDLFKLDQRDCDELRKDYLMLACSKVPRRWNAQLVDKNPMNMLWLPMIHRLFPKAKFILALRHPCDVILSCYMQNFRSAVLAIASATIVDLAHAYVAAMECWIYHVDVFKPDLLVSRYEELVADTHLRTQRIAEFLGVGEGEAMLKFDVRAREKGFIATPSYTQVIEPINTKGLNRWHRYREHLEPALPILQPILDYWGYQGADIS